MTLIPELQRLARSCTGNPEQAIVQLLRLLCEQLDMSLAMIGTVEQGLHTARLVVESATGRRPDLELTRPADQTWCGAVSGDAPLVVRDVTTLPELASSRPAKIRCYAGTVLRDHEGRELGVLGVMRLTPHDRLDPRDVTVLEGLAEVVGGLYAAFLSASVEDADPPLPQQRLPAAAAASVPADDVEGLTRPLLDAMHELSGIASTYLTVVDDEGLQTVHFAHNAKDDFTIPEGYAAPFDASMCQRSIDAGGMFTTSLPTVWPECHDAVAIGMVTFMSAPVRLPDGRLWGTLCAADDVARGDAGDHVSTLGLFARLIAAELERAAAVRDERARASLARLQADTDELTGCASRRLVHPWLERALMTRSPDELVVLAFVDVDRFKDVNDRLGHATGDLLLSTLGSRLARSARPGDLVARLGGDEFVVGARLPREAVGSLGARVRSAGQFVLATAEGPLEVRCSTGLADSDSAPNAEALLCRSDAAMYRDKALAQV